MKKSIYLLLIFLSGITTVYAQGTYSQDSASSYTYRVYLTEVGNADDSTQAWIQWGTNSASLDSSGMVYVTDLTAANTQSSLLLNGATAGTKYYFRIIVFDPATILDPPTGIRAVIPASGVDSVTTLSLVPSITSIAPNTAVAGSPTFTLVIEGMNFVPTSTVLWNGSPRTITYLSAGGDTIWATIPSSDLLATGSPLVNVDNPGLGGGLSNTMLFNIICPTITVNAGSNQTLTTGQTVSGNASQLGAVGTPTFSIAGAPAGISINPSTGAYSGSSVAVGSYTATVTVTDQNSCTGNSVFTIDIVCPVVPITVSSPSTICIGSSVSLTASGASSYVWNPGAQSTSSIIVSPTSNTTYTVVGTDVNGCTGTDTVPVVVNPLPVVNAASNTTICLGNSATLTASGASSYLWSSGQTAVSISVAPTTTASYTVTGTDVNGCVNTANVSVTVNTLPVITASAPQSICIGNSATLTANGGASYSWEPGTIPGSPIVVNPTASTTYTVYGTDANGCSASATSAVTVNPLPVVTANSSPASICLGSSVTLTGGGALTYNWMPGNLSGASQTLSPVASTTYVVTGTDVNGCIATASVAVVVNNLPVVSASSSSPAICAGSSVTLTGSGATSYSWNPGNLNGSPITDSPTTNTTYTVVGTDVNGCTASANVAVTVNALPIVSASSSSPSICIGNSAILTGSGAVTYNWMPGNLSGSPVTVSPTANTTYTVAGIDLNGCTASANVAVVVNNLPVVNSAALPSSICTGSSSTLLAAGASTYIWNPGNIPGSPIIVSPTINTTYTVVGTDVNGCTGTDTVPVVVNALPVVSAATSSPSACLGGSFTLISGGANSYNWMPGNTPGTSIVVSPTVSTTYTVTGTDLNGCVATQTVAVVVNPLPVISASATPSVVCNGSSATLTGSGAVAYTWNPGNLSGSPVTVTPTSNTVYIVVGTDINGCIGTNVVSVAVNGPLTLVGNFPAALTGQSYTGYSMSTTGGNGTYFYTVTFGNLPTGMTMLSNGTLIGNPGVAGLFLFQVTSTDNIGCSTTQWFTIQVDNPVPTLTSVSPSSGIAGNSYVVTLTGTNFAPASVALWNGSPLTTTFVSPTQLTAQVTGVNTANVGVYPIKVNTPAPGGGMTTVVPFTVNPGPPSSTTSVVITQVSCGLVWPGAYAKIDYVKNSPDSINLTFVYDYNVIGSSPSSLPMVTLGPGNQTLSRTITGLVYDSTYAFAILYQSASMASPVLSNVKFCIAPPLGVDEIAGSSEVNVFPNPLISGISQLNCGMQEGTLKLYDVTGREVMNAEVKDGKCEVGERPVSGVYVVRLFDADWQPAGWSKLIVGD